jgi:ornithine cyclodeaminase/alanine dehydrogenase-like protein (mu-crystallin family)
MTSPVPYLDAATIRSHIRPRAAVDALAAVLHDGFDPASAVPRSFVPLEHGELLLMPAELGGFAGVKIASVAPDNGVRGLPRIQGVYVLMDSLTLSPRALLDGIELTALRTPAVSLLAVRERLRADPAPLDVVVAGTRVQAVRHVETVVDVIADIRAVASVTYLSRTPTSVSVPHVHGADVRVARIGSAASDAAVAGAGLVVCATSSATPLFDGSLVREDAAVIAVGSHDMDRRELDATLMGRSCVIVEDAATALREAGDVVQAIRAGTMHAGDLVPLSKAVRCPQILPRDRSLVFKSSGMAWEDVVVAAALVQQMGL